MQKKFKQKEKTYIRLCLAADELKMDVERVQAVERILAPHRYQLKSAQACRYGSLPHQIFSLTSQATASCWEA